jgi:hypothetical protein
MPSFQLPACNIYPLITSSSKGREITLLVRSIAYPIQTQLQLFGLYIAVIRLVTKIKMTVVFGMSVLYFWLYCKHHEVEKP